MPCVTFEKTVKMTLLSHVTLGFKIQKCCDDGVRGCCCYDNSNPAVNTGIVSKNACVSGFSF